MPKHTSSAKVVDGSLVLSLPDAETPVVMRLSLEEAKSAAFTVIEKDGKHVLNVAYSDTESRDIAPFAEKEKAVNALMSASAALEKGSRVISGSANDNAGGGAGFKSVGKWTLALGVLVFLFWMVGQMNSSMPRAPLPQNIAQQSAAQSDTSDTAAQAQNSTGVPVSADAFLSGRN